MSAQPEALRLAVELEKFHGEFPTCTESAAELRRLHEENKALHQAITDPENQPSQFGTVTFAMYEALEAQRDALLEALRAAVADWDEEVSRGRWLDAARAAIKKAEEA